MKELFVKSISWIFSKIYNLLVTSATYQHIKKIQRRYPQIKTTSFHLDTYIYGDGEISIGEGTYFGKGSYIYCDPKQARIQIGKNCMISHNVQIRTYTYDPEFIHLDPDKRRYQSGDIIIGDNVWIGANVFIKQGVTIGNNVIIGAGSVVTKSFEDNLIISGIPAKIMRGR